MPLVALAEQVPGRLRPVEERLDAYGAWAASGGRSTPEVHAVRRALYQLPDRWRVVLTLLYVPDRQPIEARMRRLRLQPRTVREAHLPALFALRNVLQSDCMRTACVHNLAPS